MSSSNAIRAPIAISHQRKRIKPASNTFANLCVTAKNKMSTRPNDLGFFGLRDLFTWGLSISKLVNDPHLTNKAANLEANGLGNCNPYAD